MSRRAKTCVETVCSAFYACIVSEERGRGQEGGRALKVILCPAGTTSSSFHAMRRPKPATLITKRAICQGCRSGPTARARAKVSASRFASASAPVRRKRGETRAREG